MSDKLSHSNIQIQGIVDHDPRKNATVIDNISTETEHFALPGPTLKPRLNIQPIHPKTSQFLNKAKTTHKKTVIFRVSIALLVLAVLFFSFAGINLYASVKNSTQLKNILDCNNIINTGKNKGLNTSNLRCEVDTGWANLFGEDLSLKALLNIKQDLTNQENKLEDQINSSSDKITKLKSQLNLIKVDISKIEIAKKDDNLNIYLNNLETQKQALQLMFDQNISKLKSKLNEAQTALSKLASVDKDDKNFIINYPNLSQDQQIENYSKLEEITGKLQLQVDSLNQKSVYPIIGSLADIKFFTPAAFQQLYENTTYTNVEPASDIVNILNDINSDNYIRAIAEGRGYKKRVQAIQNNLLLVDGYKMQPKAAQDWKNLKAAAVTNKVYLGLVSGFRSYDDQRSIFNEGMQEEGVKQFGRDYTTEEITSGKADAGINSVLNTRSIPGYSKHHTGYTIDVTDVTSGKYFTSFDQTAGYTWLSENNFYNAKRFGFIPSYPKGGTNFGPNPESWEFVWVGVDAVKS